MISTGQTETVSDENGENLSDRDVLNPKAILRQSEWAKKPRGKNQIMMIVVLLWIQALDLVRCVVLTWRIDTGSTCALSPHNYRKCIKCGRWLKFVFRCQESGASGHADILPIWVGGQFRPVIVRLIGGDTELLPRMNFIAKLRISVDFG